MTNPIRRPTPIFAISKSGRRSLNSPGPLPPTKENCRTPPAALKRWRASSSAPDVSHWRSSGAEAAIAVSSDKLELHAIRAHALMFLGLDSDARTLFLRYRGQKVGERQWEAVIRESFDEQRK